MALPFQTRLTLAMSILIIIGVSIITMLVQWSAASNITKNAYLNGQNVTRLATLNIEHGTALPDKVMERVGDQMLFSALLLAELVAVSENEAGKSPEEINAILRRVVETAQSAGAPLPIDDLWVTDENGRIYIGLEAIEFQFSPDADQQPQSHEFHPLLDSRVSPVIQSFGPRDRDGENFKYVGVPGVDKPRIIQVGVGEHLLDSINRDFSVQNVVDHFATGIDVSSILIVNEDGEVSAKAGRPLDEFQGENSSDLIGFCTRYLAKDNAPVDIMFYGGELAVVTRLPSRDGEPARAMVMIYQIDRVNELITGAAKEIFAASIVIVVVAIGIIYLLSRSISRPILELADGAREFGKGNFDYRVKARSDDEIGTLANAFNAMAVNVQDSMRTLEEETRLRERLESELSIAAKMQRSLLPDHRPKAQGVELFGHCSPARQVGGDFYDYFSMGENRIGIAIGDATGKGLSAAILTTECWSAFKAFTRVSKSPAEILQHTNELMNKQVGDTGQFVTCFFMILDADRGTISYSVAGHNPPILRGTNPDRCLMLSSDHGLPLGVDPDCRFENHEIALVDHDTILLYSDGVTEAHIDGRSLYGENRLRSLLAQTTNASPEETVQNVLRDVEKHLGGEDCDDDLTVVSVHFRTNGSASAAL
jgi:serine phosphatase RsbU (regulator of sigma subunit)